MVLGQHWGAAIGAWVPLNELLSAVERELHIPSDEAARALRAPLETLRVHAEVTGWHIPTYQSRGAPIHADWTYRNGAFERRQVSAKGWAHVDWNNGTLDGFQVVVRWAHVLIHVPGDDVSFGWVAYLLITESL